MKKEAGVLIAGALGLLAVLGMIGLRKFLNLRNYDASYYEDFHRNYTNKNIKTEDHHGVEYLSVL